MRDLIPVTTPARTIIDLADDATRRELERTIDEALYLGMDLASLQPLPGRERRPGPARRGAANTRTRHHTHPLGLRGTRARVLRARRGS